MSRRKPGQSAIVTQRKEPDDVQFYRVFWRKNNRTPIGLSYLIQIRNQTIILILKITIDPAMRLCLWKKYGTRDYRGGGRSSARETASRVVAGAIAKQMLPDIKINALFLL
jgi:chorismate synthase